MSQTLREEEDSTIIAIPANVDRKPLINKEEYEALYAQSINDPDAFWAKQAERIDWIKKWERVKNTSFEGDISIKWFEGAKLNVCYNCVDRHIETRGAQTAIIWEGDDPDTSKNITYNIYS